MSRRRHATPARLTWIAPLALGAALALGSASAVAQPQVEADALTAQARLVEASDPARAAHLLERADHVAPHPDRLAAAITAATRALEPTLAMTLVERAAARPASPALDAAVAAARERFALAVAYLTVRCGACVVTIDGKPGLAGRRNVVPAGAHIVEAGEGAQVERWSISLGSGEEREVIPPWLLPASRPSAAPLPPQVALAPFGGEVATAEPLPTEPSGLGRVDPAWFWGGVAVTSAASWLTLVSAIDGVRDANRVDRDPGFFNEVAARRADHRTAILGATAVSLALGTAAIGIFAVDWGGDEPARASVRGSSLQVDGSF